MRGGEDTQARGREGTQVGRVGKGALGWGGKAGVGCPRARKAKIRLERLAQDHQSWPSTQSLGLSLQGHHSMGHFPAGGYGKEKPTIERAVNRFGSYSLSWNFLAFLSSMHHDLAVALHRGVVAVRRCLPTRPQTVQARVAWGGVRPV